MPTPLSVSTPLIVPSTSSSRRHATYFLKAIKAASSPAMNRFMGAAAQIDGANPRFTGTNAYRVVGNATRAGESQPDRYLRLIKRSLHHDWPITGNDGGYSLGYLTKSSTARDIDRVLGSTLFIDSDADNKVVTDAILAALKSGLKVAIGTGSGNNTYAYIVAVVDPRKREFTCLVNSNFGSDG